VSAPDIEFTPWRSPGKMPTSRRFALGEWNDLAGQAEDAAE